MAVAERGRGRLRAQGVDLGQEAGRHPGRELRAAPVGAGQGAADGLFAIGRQARILPGERLRCVTVGGAAAPSYSWVSVR